MDGKILRRIFAVGICLGTVVGGFAPVPGTATGSGGDVGVIPVVQMLSPDREARVG